MAEAGGRNTGYVDYLRERVGQLLVKQKTFTIVELAEFAKLKVTGNMRRRLKQWVKLGDLEEHHWKVKSGSGSQLFYMLPGDIPF